MKRYKQAVFRLCHVWYSPKENQLYMSYIGDKTKRSTLGSYVRYAVDQRLERGDIYLGTLGGRR